MPIVEMSEKETKHNFVHPFSVYLKDNRKEAYLFIIFYVVFAIVFKFCYPYVDLMSDTGGYINAIHYGLKQGGMRPLGYSYFLKLTEIPGGHHSFPVFLLQYITHCIAMFFFYSTTTYLFRLGNKYVRYGYMMAILLFIPGLYATNIVMTDSLFTSLTVILITLSLWLVHTRNVYLFVALIAVIAVTVSLRYIGLVYPVYIIAVILATYKKSGRSLLFSIVIIVLAFAYVTHVKEQTKKDRGVEVFSAFGGWQKANNALHVIPHIDITRSAVNTTDPELLRIDTIVRITYPYNKQYYPNDYSVSYEMMWLDSVPLTLAQNYYLYKYPGVDFFTIWNRCGVLFSQYADLLVSDHFPQYFRYYILNNTLHALHPPEEIFTYHADTTYSPIVNAWFGWDADEDIRPRYDFLRSLLQNLSGSYSLYWMLFFIGNVYFIFRVKRKNIDISSAGFVSISLLFFFVWMYLLASIYAAPVNLRFLLPVRVVILGLIFVLLQYALDKWRDNKQVVANKFV